MHNLEGYQDIIRNQPLLDKVPCVSEVIVGRKGLSQLEITLVTNL